MTMQRGFAYPLGARVRLKSGGTEMLVVDLDPERSELIAAWKNGDAVSEATFDIATLRPSGVAVG